MKILVINCGSSSFKYQLIDMATETPLCSGVVERIGEGEGSLTHKKAPDTDTEQKFVMKQVFVDHTAGLSAVMQLLTDAEKGVITDVKEIAGVGHRVVQGGERLQKACILGEAEKQAIRELSPLAPLHNPANLQGIEVAQKLLPHAPSVAVFDTEFHATMPEKAFLYPLPYSLYEELGVRRYGFHGTSHGYVAEAAAAFLGKPYNSFNAITCHLGNGASLAAVKNGKCVDTSMGMTPLAGVMMGTRCGDIDPAIHNYLAQNKGMDVAAIDSLLNKESGLKGVCGMNDMRDIDAACKKGDALAQLAFDMFCYRVKHYLGAYYAILGRVDAVIFTAGIGEKDEKVRAGVCADLEHMGIVLDAQVNNTRADGIRNISTKESRVPVLVVPTNEELAIARATKVLL